VTGHPIGEVEWTAEKLGEAWRLKSVPLPPGT
jgi:hypothetical protein